MKRPVRFPVFCTRCGSTTHYAEDCTRMPAALGMSQHEREMVAMVKADRRAIGLLVLVFMLALVIVNVLERAPA